MINFFKTTASKTKKPKYNNKKVEYDGLKFDSLKEKKRYVELCVMQQQGLISDLRCQVAFELIKSVKFSTEPRAKPALKYYADFVYMQGGRQIVEDVKSAITRKDKVYRIKRHLMKALLDIEIKEI